MVFGPFRNWPATVEENDNIEVRKAGLEVRLRDFDDQDNDFSVGKILIYYAVIALWEYWKIYLPKDAKKGQKVREAGLEVILRDFDNQENDF